jgi:glyoxylase-like metal-dependent hydrolase (beta-lactamase superfamily II)
MSGRDKKFSEGYEINSLAMAHQGATVSPFHVSRWLKEGDVISLDDTCVEPQQRYRRALHVLETPGHTPDSCAFYFPHDQRIFVGDTLCTTLPSTNTKIFLLK